MKLTYLIVLGAGLAMVLTGCQNPDGTQNNTASGALIGGAMGAITGAAIGGPRHGGPDALIGAAAGALAGGLIGNSVDREQSYRYHTMSAPAYTPPPAAAPVNPMSMADVKALVKAGVGEDIIITQIQTSHSVFHLSANDIIDLRDAGVTDRVMNFMINTANAAPAAAAPVIDQAPPAPVAETVVVTPGPGYVWVRGEYYWNGYAWIWVGGHWLLPPHPGMIWIGGRSWHDRWGWHFERGHWH